MSSSFMQTDPLQTAIQVYVQSASQQEADAQGGGNPPAPSTDATNTPPMRRPSIPGQATASGIGIDVSGGQTGNTNPTGSLNASMRPAGGVERDASMGAASNSVTNDSYQPRTNTRGVAPRPRGAAASPVQTRERTGPAATVSRPTLERGRLEKNLSARDISITDKVDLPNAQSRCQVTMTRSDGSSQNVTIYGLHDDFPFLNGSKESYDSALELTQGSVKDAMASPAFQRGEPMVICFPLPHTGRPLSGQGQENDHYHAAVIFRGDLDGAAGHVFTTKDADDNDKRPKVVVIDPNVDPSFSDPVKDAVKVVLNGRPVTPENDNIERGDILVTPLGARSEAAGAGLELKSNLDKRLNPENPVYTQVRPFGQLAP